MDYNIDISVVIPAYNEENNIKPMVERCQAYLKDNFLNYEIIIVDDGSTDNTGKIIDALAQMHKGIVKVIHHHSNQGYGAALRTGFYNSHGDLVFYTDSDNQFDIGQINEFMPFVDSFDILLGYRYCRHDPFYRLIISWCYNFLVSLIFNLRVKDVNAAFKIFHRYVFKDIDIKSDEFFVDAEIIAKARHNNYTIFERPVRHFYRQQGNTTINYRHVISTLKEMFSVYRELRSKK